MLSVAQIVAACCEAITCDSDICATTELEGTEGGSYIKTSSFRMLEHMLNLLKLGSEISDLIQGFMPFVKHYTQDLGLLSHHPPKYPPGVTSSRYATSLLPASGPLKIPWQAPGTHSALFPLLQTCFSHYSTSLTIL
jgi:hypothetical protein